MLDREYFHINERLPVDWDEQWNYDRNHHNRGYEFLRDRIVSWDQTRDHPTLRDQYGHRSNGPYICDLVSLQDEHWNPYHWQSDALAEHWDDLWGSRIRCCLRAGLDLACEPSTGVLGFTAGDIRRMYRGRVPDWIFGDEPLEVQLGLVPGKREMNGHFASLPDAAGVWL